MAIQQDEAQAKPVTHPNMESEGRNMKGESDLTDVIDAIDVTDSNVPEFLMA